MPYVKREEYLNWLNWAKAELKHINEARHCDLTGEDTYYIGFRYANHRLCLLKDYQVLAKGMKNITKAIILLKRRYGLCQY